MPARRFFTDKEAAARIGVSKERFERIVMAYGIKVAPLTKRITMISREELDRLIELRKQVATRTPFAETAENAGASA